MTTFKVSNPVLPIKMNKELLIGGACTTQSSNPLTCNTDVSVPHTSQSNQQQLDILYFYWTGFHFTDITPALFNELRGTSNFHLEKGTKITLFLSYYALNI